MCGVLSAALLLSLCNFPHTTHSPFCSTSLFLCGCCLVMFYIWFCFGVKPPVALIVVHVLYLTLDLFPHSHTLQNKEASITWHIPQLRFNFRVEVERCLNFVFEWKWYCLSKQDVFLSLCVHTSVPLTLTHTAACKRQNGPGKCAVSLCSFPVLVTLVKAQWLWSVSDKDITSVQGHRRVLTLVNVILESIDYL